MAGYNQQQQPPHHGRGYPAEQQRDAAYNETYAGRSQTMTSQSYQSYPQERAQTISAQTMDRMQRGPPLYNQPGNGYPPPMPNQYQGGHPQPMRAPTMPVPRSGGQPQYPPSHQMPPQQYNQFPPRAESRPQTGRAYPNGAPPNRYPPQGQQALPEQYQRAQTLTSSRPQMYPTPGGGYNVAPAQTFRQQQYNPMNRTTAQGRVVPERQDERTLSLSSYGREEHSHQTMSGRVIPSRKRESNETLPDRSSQGSIPTSPVNARQRTGSQSSHPSRSFSMASTIIDGQKANGVPSSAQSQQGVIIHQRRAPLVYPALLSRVADSFKDRINLLDQSKDGLDYKSAFTGEDAVTTIAYIIKTTDRNLALLLGRSLDAQKFFHDVTYAHRLRDLRSELYQFQETVVEDVSEVNGVFTLLTECYSPTCTRDRLCYSIACPRRLEQQARLKMRPQPILKRADSHTSLHDEGADDHTLWSTTVSKAVLDSVSDKEKKRQEVIYELAYTERDFVKDIEYMRDFWMKPLRDSRDSPIPIHRREEFIKAVFSNISEVYGVNSKLAEALTKRQQESTVVRSIGDIFLEHVPRFKPFITYGSHQLFGKHAFETEKKSNPAFAKFVQDTERMKESRKLELNGYLTKPTTRLARYPLLLEGIMKNTPDEDPDKKNIPKAIALVKEFLGKVNEESGRAENAFTLMNLDRDLNWRQVEKMDLRLTEANRQLLFKGMLKRQPQDQQGDIQAYLFDHAVLLVRVKTINKKEDLKVFRKPIPLELLTIAEMNEMIHKGVVKRTSGLIGGRSQTMTSQSDKNGAKQGLPITFKHLGKGGYDITLYCSTPIQQQKWMEMIDTQQRQLRESSNVYTKTILNEGFFNSTNRVNCCVPMDGGRKLVLGTEAGVYVCDSKPKDSSVKPKRVLDLRSVTSIEVLESHQIFLVLSDKTVFSYSLDALESEDSAAASKRGRKICHANFFKAGVCQGQQIVCCVKTSALSSTIKVYEPMDSMAKKSKKSGFAKMLTTSQDVLKPLREIFIPTESSSIHFLRSKICVGCARGFEVVSLETLEAQSLLDQADTSLDFVQRKENIKPVHIERMAAEFLLCYTDYSFFVNRNGWRAKPDWIISWEGTPQAFAVFNPYILAFEPNFIEIRHMDDGRLLHISTANKIRMLHSSSREILYAYEDETGDDVIASIDFWGSKDNQPQQSGPTQQRIAINAPPNAAPTYGKEYRH
ncbi:CNH-domain-containing protein [Microthyrium microscopicum]|uniref:CNH-domain-containing protein n=1 Tax=Microthyrium microscopicum TaxID=703497 RepID=A0A6A6UL60_9PEZI|nr:CNH-domain-containing protein [Microthyrium microscopicum]